MNQNRRSKMIKKGDRFTIIGEDEVFTATDVKPFVDRWYYKLIRLLIRVFGRRK